MQSFYDWLRNRDQEAPAVADLALAIAQAGAAGISIDRLRRLCGLYPETLADVLRGLVATGQVVVMKVNGQMVYRAAG
jgi:predicted transcriptional regulator